MKTRYERGNQPCQNLKRTRDSNGYGEWDNVHECYGPWKPDGTRIGGCSGTVTYCENCHKDHHIDGYETCPQARKEEQDEEC